jgi:hypothetical protein
MSNDLCAGPTQGPPTMPTMPTMTVTQSFTLPASGTTMVAVPLP